MEGSRSVKGMNEKKRRGIRRVGLAFTGAQAFSSSSD